MAKQEIVEWEKKGGKKRRRKERGSKTDFKGFIIWLIFPSSQIPKFHMYFLGETQHLHKDIIVNLSWQQVKYPRIMMSFKQGQERRGYKSV